MRGNVSKEQKYESLDASESYDSEIALARGGGGGGGKVGIQRWGCLNEKFV